MSRFAVLMKKTIAYRVREFSLTKLHSVNFTKGRLNGMAKHSRKSTFWSSKLRALRKRNGLTLEELSARCIQIEPQRSAIGLLSQHDRERQAHAVRGGLKLFAGASSSASRLVLR